MKNNFISIFTLLFIALSFSSCTSEKKQKASEIRPYKPVDQELQKTISTMDSLFFNAYNTCDIKKQAFIYADTIEFFHDKGGLMTSKTEILDATEKNICGKVTREVLPESIEVYPIKGYGAVEIGFHKFYNNQEPDAPSIPSKFIIVWKQVNQDWKISKVVSLH